SVAAAGNFGNGTVQNGITYGYTTSPGNGYNTLSVGSYGDGHTLDWSDDAMSSFSSFVDPHAPDAFGAHAKPEVAAEGDYVISTYNTTDPTMVMVSDSGTSFSSPTVAGLAADLVEADPTLNGKPAALKAIIMAGALHNVEGDARLSDKDGVGGVVPPAS